MISKEKGNLHANQEENNQIEIKVDEKIIKEIEEIEIKNKRDLSGLWSLPIMVASIGLFVFHMYTGWFGAYFSLIQRSIHFMLILTLTFSLFARSKKTPRDKIQLYDLVFIGLSIILCFYILTNIHELVWRAGAANSMDVFLGVILVLLTLEATRRAVGLPMMLVAVFFLLYALVFGPYMPGRFSHGTFSIKRVAYYLYLTDAGIFGTPLGVSASFVYLFILFGAIMNKTGAGKFFIDFATALTGYTRGGPAKAAVVSSGMMGTVSGSSTANTVTTGSFTIPLMKSIGYSSVFAGAVEPVASTGGQIMPPIMGAAAFIMAEFLGVPYIEIAKAAIFPAIFYYFALFMAVDFRAAKIGLRGLSREQLPNLFKTLKTGWILLAPIFALVYLLVQGYSPQKSVVLSIVVLIIVSMFSKKTRLTPKKFLEAITEAGLSATTVAVACAAAGIIVGITTMSGLGLKFTGIVFEVSHGILPIALVLASLASLVLGMGIPTTANYIIMATLIAPALIRLMPESTHLIMPHMFVFYYGILADITPPVMLAVFAGAAIARAPAMKVGIESTKLAIPGYTLPFMFIFHPELISWNFIADLNLIKLVFFLLLATAMSIGIAGGMQGYLIRKTKYYERMTLLAGSFMIIPANSTVNVLGLILIGAILVLQILFKEKETVLLKK
ncbi:MAG TPA: TRAP transporter permease [Candidatus Atribacteria bacterium]|nr:TRAP transporter permease [Candidatus Atribacteria bacterium]